MCDFHSTAWRLIGQDVQFAHNSKNSHSQMIADAGWKENQPNRKTIIFEAEWDGKSTTGCDVDGLPSTTRLVRNSGEIPDKVEKAIRSHYRKLKECLATGKHLTTHFSDFEKWADVWAKVTTLPEGVAFPAKCEYLDLNSLTTLPEGVAFPKKADVYIPYPLRESLRAKGVMI